MHDLLHAIVLDTKSLASSPYTISPCALFTSAGITTTFD